MRNGGLFPIRPRSRNSSLAQNVSPRNDNGIFPSPPGDNKKYFFPIGEYFGKNHNWTIDIECRKKLTYAPSRNQFNRSCMLAAMSCSIHA